MLRGLVFTVVGALMMLAHAAHAADASALFAEGERAFAVGEYGEALRLFEAARLAGSTGPSVQYNIGVCEYRLRNYDAAEATFAELATSFPALRELAEYNKGLALRAGGRPAEARSAFARASGSTDDKIAALANAQLAELGSPAPIAASVMTTTSRSSTSCCSRARNRHRARSPKRSACSPGTSVAADCVST